MGTQDTRTIWRNGKPQVDHALLEDQMCSYTGAPGEESPDVLDALVWGITELMLSEEATAEELLEAMKKREQLAKQRAAKPAQDVAPTQDMIVTEKKKAWWDR